MKMGKVSRKTALALGLVAVLGALVIAGCGGGGSSSSSAETSAGAGSGGSESETVKASESGGSAGTIGTAEVAGLGTVLVDSEGMTVYDFTVDKGTKSECYGGCEAAWPPVTTTGKPTAGAGAMSSALGTTKRKDGTLQVTYEGHPLYTYGDDQSPGEANGQEEEGTWFVLDAKGAQVTGTPSSGGGGGDNTTGTTTTGGGGY
jgi:predicted lipoprotein with Yx(FWY)xxD motif